MDISLPIETTVQAQLSVPFATAQIVQFNLKSPSNTIKQKSEAIGSTCA